MQYLFWQILKSTGGGLIATGDGGTIYSYPAVVRILYVTPIFAIDNLLFRSYRALLFVLAAFSLLDVSTSSNPPTSRGMASLPPASANPPSVPTITALSNYVGARFISEGHVDLLKKRH